MSVDSRRDFLRVMTQIALSTPLLFAAAARGESPSRLTPEHFRLSANGWVPNNPHLPVLLYRQVLPLSGAVTQHSEQAFQHNGWPPQWVAGVFDFHHYHSTAHEVLGVVGGEARLMLGGPRGKTVTVNAGDVVLLPAGTGHCNTGSSDDFLVVGAYPPDQHWDICRSAPTAGMQQRIASLPYPHQDPVSGQPQPLMTLWDPLA
ncbi:cupin domain-containing protein [Tatumella punctata]|uniref:Cupin domain-containing protein n=1 Tax=Tatumella punctata TaxID=399969 RepID=A0ABW1VPM1_9GAMM